MDANIEALHHSLRLVSMHEPLPARHIGAHDLSRRIAPKLTELESVAFAEGNGALALADKLLGQLG